MYSLRQILYAYPRYVCEGVMMDSWCLYGIGFLDSKKGIPIKVARIEKTKVKIHKWPSICLPLENEYLAMALVNQIFMKTRSNQYSFVESISSWIPRDPILYKQLALY